MTARDAGGRVRLWQASIGTRLMGEGGGCCCGDENLEIVMTRSRFAPAGIKLGIAWAAFAMLLPSGASAGCAGQWDLSGQWVLWHGETDVTVHLEQKEGLIGYGSYVNKTGLDTSSSNRTVLHRPKFFYLHRRLEYARQPGGGVHRHHR